MVNCDVTDTKMYSEEKGETITVYGLRFFYLTEKKGESIQIIEDLFFEKKQAIAAMKRINVLGISEIHIYDIVADMIADEADNSE